MKIILKTAFYTGWKYPVVVHQRMFFRKKSNGCINCKCKGFPCTISGNCDTYGQFCEGNLYEMFHADVKLVGNWQKITFVTYRCDFITRRAFELIYTERCVLWWYKFAVLKSRCFRMI